MTQLNDLYYYLESKTVLTPCYGALQFKLHPFQRKMLQFIHESDRLLIVKARQIGATQLLAGYIAWRFNRTGRVSVINSIKHVCAEELYKRVKWFEPEYPKLYTDGRGLITELTVYDEWNYNPNCGKPYDHTRFLQPGKHIITGTPDSDHKLYNLCVELTGRTNPYTARWFPAKWCEGMWSNWKIKNMSKMLTPEQFRHEVKAEW